MGDFDSLTNTKKEYHISSYHNLKFYFIKLFYPTHKKPNYKTNSKCAMKK